MIVLSIIFVYITNISSIPENLVLFQHEPYQMNLLKGIELKHFPKEKDSSTTRLSYETKDWVEKDSKIKTDLIGNVKLTLTALGVIPLKDISVSVVPERLVIPGGQTVGVRLYAKGVLVIGKSIVEGVDGNDYEPYQTTEIEAGDSIVAVNGTPIERMEELQELVEASEGATMTLRYVQNGVEKEDTITPIKALDGNGYKIGLWVRDGTMGIGTVSFVDVETGEFAALGHGVSDMDTKEKIEMESGSLHQVRLLSITKGEKEHPGEILGVLQGNQKIGDIEKNTNIGIYGTLSPEIVTSLDPSKAVKIASRKEIELGKATILCTLAEGEAPQEYEIEIQKKYLDQTASSKCMLIHVTDERLLAKTGGIIQGMSGSPILQNGKLIGSVTHVLVNDPTRGYAVFADSMLEETLWDD